MMKIRRTNLPKLLIISVLISLFCIANPTSVLAVSGSGEEGKEEVGVLPPQHRNKASCGQEITLIQTIISFFISGMVGNN